MSGKPTGFNYQACKDSIKWNHLDPQETIPTIKNMFIAFVNNLPAKK